MGKKEAPPPAAASPSLHSLAEALRAGGVEVREAAAAPAPTPAPSVERSLARSGKIVVRRERHGHGGKTVTVVAGIALPPAKLEELAQRLRKALGCGSRVEGGQILLQGDRAPAVEVWLRAQGAARVVRGN